MRLILILLSFSFTSCFGQKGVLTAEFVAKEFNVVSVGEYAPERNKLLLVCYNKYFNRERFPYNFRIENNLNTINYRKNMAVEIFMGEQHGSVSNLRIEKVEENKAVIQVHYSFDQLQEMNDSTKSPFVIVEIPKSRKPVIFFENGEEVKMRIANIYN